ncbi:glutamate-5-semialdehyde dehydrogenase [Caloramator sp. E03]|uniref:glutamate-5-semialdehyde dehydrogenase n=1 Tax=Caloramator sp. E03 TaxID=2576307 RepID=UPI0011103C60|nr:glutamate-5-semialdehyde dehydrogenase [Caloramator sp. E03]QCX34447.1 glutamate-5-semialdehyde dehydrogenase [Caloramator sp. E03]
MDIYSYVEEKGYLAKKASKELNNMQTNIKNKALINMAQALKNNIDKILTANELDMAEGKNKNLSSSLLDRLLLNEKRINDMAEGLLQVAALPDPVGEILRMWKRPNGLQIGQIRVPIGVIGIIYEARPNVTVDAAALCIKSGNAVILRGGSEAINSNKAITDIISSAAFEAGLPKGCIQLIETTDREATRIMMKMNKYLDLLIPRGGAGLIKTVIENSTVPVIETGVGNCHVYIDNEADIKMAEDIVINAKTQRPGVCNAMETLLVHKDIADKILPDLCKKLNSLGVEIRGCKKTKEIVPYALEATEEDYFTEFLDLILAIKVVDSLDEAIEHIYKYGTKHSEAIVTKNYFNAQSFLKEVDAAAVYVNASTRFTDGYEFGFGAEIGISTQKMHARGPMGLNELTTTKYIIYGDGQIR